MCAVAVYFIMERVVDSDLIIAMIVDRIRKQVETSSMSCSIIAP